MGASAGLLTQRHAVPTEGWPEVPPGGSRPHSQHPQTMGGWCYRRVARSIRAGQGTQFRQLFSKGQHARYPFCQLRARAGYFAAMSRTLMVAGVALILALLAWRFWPAPTEEDRVREVIRAVIAGAEAGDVGDVMAHVSDTFSGDSGEGSFDKPMLRSLLTVRFLKHGPIAVFVAEILVNITGSDAHASFDALLTEQSGDWSELLPINADGWHMEVDLRQEQELWRITGAQRSDIRLQ